MKRTSRKHAADSAALDRARPRHVVLTGGGRALLAVAIALFVGAPTAAILVVSVASRQSAEKRLLDDGRWANGRVTRLWRTGGEKPKQWMAYEFDIDGLTYGNQLTLPAATWRGLEVGSPLDIQYAPSDPRLNQPYDWRRRRPLPMWMGAVVAVAGVAVGALALVSIRRQRRLLEEGRAASAVVTSVAKTQHGSLVHYTFRLLSGATRTGKGGPTKGPPAIGAAIPVLYDPENPKHNAMYPFSLVELHK